LHQRREGDQARAKKRRAAETDIERQKRQTGTRVGHRGVAWMMRDGKTRQIRHHAYCNVNHVRNELGRERHPLFTLHTRSPQAPSPSAFLQRARCRNQATWYLMSLGQTQNGTTIANSPQPVLDPLIEEEVQVLLDRWQKAMRSDVRLTSCAACASFVSNFTSLDVHELELLR
jgi:hypothetical protein